MHQCIHPAFQSERLTHQYLSLQTTHAPIHAPTRASTLSPIRQFICFSFSPKQNPFPHSMTHWYIPSHPSMHPYVLCLPCDSELKKELQRVKVELRQQQEQMIEDALAQSKASPNQHRPTAKNSKIRTRRPRGVRKTLLQSQSNSSLSPHVNNICACGSARSVCVNGGCIGDSEGVH